ncbi:hypothetical protein DT019_03130 [Streptomyces sp. SDr-06]|uniref:hypothetical protein n=1 Tax=Streptomyces sp. SDr-06 TaxID=2267702 RepID=UPI000DEA25AB|nr:hypothetical protein [Streptomyces sp. SDr-06]RCH70497.1 hypothetical protein DT019_03130 [Streptomyces sp. SDr-06]
MTSHPIPENHNHWWLTCGKWRRLHAIPGTAISRDEMRDAIDECVLLPARAACRLRRAWDYPGLGSRFGRRRCTACCQAIEIPNGHGTPANNPARTETP